MDKLGFSGDCEFLPSFDKFQNSVNKRRMFLKLFNQEVSSLLKFSKEELCCCVYSESSLCDIFINKVVKNLQFDLYMRSSLKFVDIQKTNKFNSFFKKIKKTKGRQYPRFSILNSYNEANFEKAEALINLLQDNNFSFYLDSQKMFKNFVSNKILKTNRDRKVEVHQDSIDIDSHVQKTKIYTFWQFLDSNDLNIDDHIQKAVECIKTTEFNQVYLVYPKNENFNRHIKINCDSQLINKEYEIKLIPYSLRSTLR